ncbi:hypothetical protein [Methanolapillus africanus]|uniref:hypothetical protein n=1 Tax=Methanolapillus africanus TaxID=3028297 RepID=UPI0030B8BD32
MTENENFLFTVFLLGFAGLAFLLFYADVTDQYWRSVNLIFLILSYFGPAIYGFVSKDQKRAVVLGFVFPFIFYLLEVVSMSNFFKDWPSVGFILFRAGMFLSTAVVAAGLGWVAAMTDRKFATPRNNNILFIGLLVLYSIFALLDYKWPFLSSVLLLV